MVRKAKLEEGRLVGTAQVLRRAFEPGLRRDLSGRPVSTGSCLYAAVLVASTLNRFRSAQATIRGGDGADDLGVLGTDLAWHGHYWVEAGLEDGRTFVVDITADQFGHEPVVVLLLAAAQLRYRPGPQAEVDSASVNLAESLGIREFIVA